MKNREGLEANVLPLTDCLLTNIVKISTVKKSDIDEVSALLLDGVSLHSNHFWSGGESRHDWLARVHGSRERFFCEETRLARAGNRLIGAFALAGVIGSGTETWADIPASLRFFVVDPYFVSGRLVHLLLGSAVRIAQTWDMRVISAEISPEKNGMLPAFERFGFRPTLGLRTGDGNYGQGARVYTLDMGELLETGIVLQ